MILDAGGTEADTADYILGETGKFDLDLWVGSYFENLTLGGITEWNTFTIRNASVLTAGQVTAGGSASGNHNTIAVTGEGSTLDARARVTIGDSGSSNRLIVSDGGFVGSTWSSSPSIVFTVGGMSGSSRNSVLVTGSGSTVSANTFQVGLAGDHNDVRVENSGTVVTNYGYVGVVSDSFSAGYGNSVTVTGNGSSWRSDYVLTIGDNGQDNRMRIEDGGSLSVGDKFYDIVASRPPAALMIGREAGDNRLEITGGGNVHSTSAAIGVFDMPASEGYTGGNGNNQALVSGAGSVWTNDEAFYVGWGQPDNTLTVENGGAVSTGSATIGLQDTALDNRLTVRDAGTQFDISDALIIGAGGAGNTLTIENGALVALHADDASALVIDAEGAGGNFLRLHDGYFAWAGDQTEAVRSLLDGGLIQVFDGENWITATLDNGFELAWFETDAEALDWSGYDHLGGYTLFTASLAVIPEPASWLILAGLTALVVVVLRRKICAG